MPARELHEAFNFEVAVDGFLETAYFSSCGPIEASITVDAYREAGATLPIRDPLTVDVEPLTLEIGATRSFEFYRWFLETVRSLHSPLEEEFSPAAFKRSITIRQLTRDKKTAKKITLFGAFPIGFLAGEWNADDDAVVIERLVLAYDFFEIKRNRFPVPASTPPGG